MAKPVETAIRYPELGELLRSRRLTLRYRVTELSREIYGDSCYTWRFHDIEKGLIRTSPESIELCKRLVKLYKVSQKEKVHINYYRKMPQIEKEIEDRCARLVLGLGGNPIIESKTGPRRRGI